VARSASSGAGPQAPIVAAGLCYDMPMP
jgi:hypothetical protein